jgi:predicted kinase
VDFYESYRAYVRAKVSMFLAADARAEEPLRRRAEVEARRYLLLALSANRPALLPPLLVCVGGIIASGKSTLAQHIALELSAAVVEADRTRKDLLGVAPEAHVDEGAWQGAYSPDFTDRVYDEVFRRAGVVLASGRPVVVDASFRTRHLRQRAHDLAATNKVTMLFIECRLDPEVARERLRRRETMPGVSDARLSLFDDFCARYEPPDELPPAVRLVLDTGRPLEESLTNLREHLATWPRGLLA